MSNTEKKEPGQADIHQPERGDPRLTPPPKSQPPDPGPNGAHDRPPADSDHDKDSPWMGGG
jgi:hypothetical protein